MLAILVVLFGAIYWIARMSAKGERNKGMEDVLDDVEEAKEVERDIARMSRDELLDELRKQSDK